MIFLTPLAPSPQQVGIDFASYITLGIAVITLIGTIVSKKAKTPADELAKADFAYTKIKERLEEVDKDRTYLGTANEALREALRRADDDATISMQEKRDLRNLIAEGETRIHDLDEQNRLLNDRLTAIADKVKAGLPITLIDVYGNAADMQSARSHDLGELEFTVIPHDKD